jgi:ribosomal protein S18 acetylase RimI-like enzyme
MPDLEFVELNDSSLNLINEVHALFPHWKRASVQKKLAATRRKKDRRFVAISNGKVIAHVRVIMGKSIHKHRAQILSLVVSNSMRRKGIGTKLMKFVIKELSGKKSLLILEVDKNNLPAIKLYKKLGFKKYGLLEKASIVSGKSVDNVLMRKEI